MSRRHNTKHYRIGGGYKRRLEKRGLRNSPMMEDVDTLRRRQRDIRPVPETIVNRSREWMKELDE